ncbi:S41 family peptidase [Hugenholtzia roseola]|uniref:S41 family peptidase n=1 Tax=Hugenholtzia roseola TaxID=1002 RepID=UPI0004234A0F|nr:S41 family peptidase [Hugenholtzia roseola]
MSYQKRKLGIGELQSLIFHFVLGFLPLTAAFAQSPDTAPLWLRYPAISPDSKTIVFNYQGNLFKVGSEGGKAEMLTSHAGYDFQAIWSADSKMLAFASDRFGNFDVFLLAAEGGMPKRLTFHSASDMPVCFSPDGKYLYFTSSRTPIATDVNFPSRLFHQLYRVSIEGGQPELVVPHTMEMARLDKSGKKILYYDAKGYENKWRKHHTSSVTRDLWLYDLETELHTQLTDHAAEDREGVWGADGKTLYFLSERSGSFNIWKMDSQNPQGAAVQISQNEKHPIRFLTIADSEMLCYGYDGEIYTQLPNQAAKKVAIELYTDNLYNERQIKTLTSGATEFAVSPNGKEVAFVVRGEVFVTSVEGKMSKRITDTPEQERSISFSPDGKKLLFAGERNKSWNLYEVEIVSEKEKYFYAATLLKETPLVETPQETFEARYSPDGKEVAFIEDRKKLRVLNLKSKTIRTITDKLSYSYSDGDQFYAWSPDSQWFLVGYDPNTRWVITQIGLVKAEANAPIFNLTQSGYNNAFARWGIKGEAMYWLTDREGYRSHGSWGSEYDVFALYFTEAAWKKASLNKDEYALWKESKDEKEKEEADKKAAAQETNKKGDKKDNPKAEEEKPQLLSLDTLNAPERLKRLTRHASRMGDFWLNPEGTKLYYLAAFEGGLDLWLQDLIENETKLVLKLGANAAAMEMDKEGQHLFVLADGNLQKIDLTTLAPKPITFRVEMNLRAEKEREYMFEHLWRQARDKFYVSDLHGVDWDFYKKEYAKFLPHINNNYDFAEMASELLGELNASHTGSGYRAYDPASDQTASLGIFTDPNWGKKGEKGLKIVEIIEKSPFTYAENPPQSGDVITHIDGIELVPSRNYYELLNRKAGQRVLVTILESKTGASRQIVVKPISQGAESELRYQRWVKNCEAQVARLSMGKVGYVHVRGMDSESYREVYSKTLGKHADKAALIVDTRFNGGGWLHDDLATFLAGQKYFDIIPREEKVGVEPMNKWERPSVVLISEGNYSDANIFPYVYQHLGVGKLIGMPVAGTGTAVWWETLLDPTLYFGIPQVGMVRKDGKYMENTELIPDIQVKNLPKPTYEGKDAQLERAVEELLKQVKK